MNLYSLNEIVIQNEFSTLGTKILQLNEFERIISNMAQYSFISNKPTIRLFLAYLTLRENGSKKSYDLYCSKIGNLDILTLKDDNNVYTGIEDHILDQEVFTLGNKLDVDLYKYIREKLFLINTPNGYKPIPSSKGEVMRWLQGENIFDDDNVQEISELIDYYLEDNIPFLQEIASNSHFQDIYDILIMSILKIKFIKLTTKILSKYPLQ